MRRFPRFISKQLGRIIPGKLLFKTSEPFFLPFYHVVSDEKLSYGLNYPYRNTSEFEVELDFYLKYFKPVSLESLLKNEKPKEPVFHLSFDDGLSECAEIIAPILLKKGIPATFFVNTGFVDNKDLFHKYKASLIFKKIDNSKEKEVENFLQENNLSAETILKTDISKVEILDKTGERLGIDFSEFLEKQKPYLTTKQLLKLKREGFSIGAHSVNHHEFWKLSKEDQLTQVRSSMEWLNKVIQPKIKALAFPFTDDSISREVLQTIKNENICDITFGTAGVKFDEFDFHYQRYPVEIPGNFEQNLKAEYIYFYLRKCVGKATVKH